MKVNLVEEYSPNVKFLEGDLVIALTPPVCYQLDKAGVVYSLLSTHDSEMELLSSEPEHEARVFRQVDALDRLLKEEILELRERNLNLAKIYLIFLRASVFGSVSMRCKEMRGFLERVRPLSVTYISRDLPKIVPFDFTLRDVDESESYRSQATELLCASMSTPFSRIHPEVGHSKLPTGNTQRLGLKARTREALSRSKTIRTLYSTIKTNYYLRKASPTSRGSKPLRILLLKTAHLREDLIADMLRRGHQIYLLTDNTIVECPLSQRIQKLDINWTSWKHLSYPLENSAVVELANEECNLDISSLILPRLRYFAEEICPQLLAYTKLFSDFYRRRSIDFVVTPHRITPAEMGAVLATSCNKTRSVCIQHGNEGFSTAHHRILDLNYSDILITDSTETMREYEPLKQEIGAKTKIYGSHHRLASIERIKTLREKKSVVVKNRVIYMPTFFQGNFQRQEGAGYPDAWYYLFQKKLLEYFSSRREFNFVWKGLPSGDRAFNPLIDFIRESNFSNVKIATDLLQNHLASADRVICDFISSGFYESVVAGVPTICLYRDTNHLRVLTKEYFGHMLEEFSEAEDAIEIIDRFLVADPSKYQMDIKLDQTSIISILEEEAK